MVTFRYGQFSHLWIDMMQRMGLDVTVIDRPWGEGADEALLQVCPYRQCIQLVCADMASALVSCLSVSISDTDTCNPQGHQELWGDASSADRPRQSMLRAEP